MSDEEATSKGAPEATSGGPQDGLGVAAMEREEPGPQEPGPQVPGKGKRVLLSLLFAVLYQVAEVVFWAVALFQNIYLLVTGRRNERLNSFSDTLTSYIYDCISYATLRSDSRPWPLDEPEKLIIERP